MTRKRYSAELKAKVVPEVALARFGAPEIFNTDQSSQLSASRSLRSTSPRFTDILKGGGERWMDNVFIERLWRSMKYECVYLHGFETGFELRADLERWISNDNTRRPQPGLDGQTPGAALAA